MTKPMPYEFDDGGRAAAGFKGTAGDCVTRAVAIASGRPYAEVYAALADLNAKQRKGPRMKGAHVGKRTARNGIFTNKAGFKRYMESLGFKWTPTMRIGSGCKVHLAAGELPMGRLVCNVSRHCVAVIDGVVRDTYDPQREDSAEFWVRDSDYELKPGESITSRYDDGTGRITVMVPRGGRCVYGYWSYAPDA